MIMNCSKKLLTSVYPECTIISGGCSGTDTLAERYADEHKLEKKVYLPNPSKGAGRFHARNKQIVKDSNKLIAFLSKNSKGTQHTIALAISAKIPVIIYNIDGGLVIITSELHYTKLSSNPIWF